MSQVSVYIIAFNEADKVRATIESVRWADDPAHYRTIGLDYEP